GGRVSVIGWSLGGVYARELARVAPNQIRQAITLGSPFRLTSLGQTRTARLYARYRSRHEPRYQVPPYTATDAPLSGPSTAIYTRGDGIVAWQTCVQPVGTLSENMEERGSHCGLGHNPAGAYAVRRRRGPPRPAPTAGAGPRAPGSRSRRGGRCATCIRDPSTADRRQTGTSFSTGVSIRADAVRRQGVRHATRRHP